MVFLEDRSVRVDAPDLDVGILFLQVASDSADGAACSHTNNKVGDLSLGLFPDLGPGAFIMRLTVRQVVVLIGKETVGYLFIQLSGHRVIAFRMVGSHIGRTDMQLGAHGPEHIHLFPALFVVQRADQFVALDNGPKCEPHPCIS